MAYFVLLEGRWRICTCTTTYYRVFTKVFLTWGIPWVLVSRGADHPSWPRAGSAESRAGGQSSGARAWGRWTPAEKREKYYDNFVEQLPVCSSWDHRERLCRTRIFHTKVSGRDQSPRPWWGCCLWPWRWRVKILISGKDLDLGRQFYWLGSCCQLENILKTDLIPRQSWIVGCNDDMPAHRTMQYSRHSGQGWGGGGEFRVYRDFLWFLCTVIGKSETATQFIS